MLVVADVVLKPTGRDVGLLAVMGAILAAGIAAVIAGCRSVPASAAA